MQLVETPIKDLVILEPTLFGDERGFFMETFRAEWLPEHTFVQDNHSQSVGGILRGLHYQLTKPQGKLVRVTAGEVYDVALDLRQSSATFGQWYGVLLSSANKRLLFVPPGFAHGFLLYQRQLSSNTSAPTITNPRTSTPSPGMILTLLLPGR